MKILEGCVGLEGKRIIVVGNFGIVADVNRCA